MCFFQVDLAAKDKRCTNFEAHFSVEILFLPLDGEFGTGPALDTSRRSLLEAPGNLSLLRPTSSIRDQALQWERDGYRQYLLRNELSQDTAPLCFEDWLLGWVSTAANGTAGLRRQEIAEIGGLSRRDPSPVRSALGYSRRAPAAVCITQDDGNLPANIKESDDNDQYEDENCYSGGESGRAGSDTVKHSTRADLTFVPSGSPAASPAKLV